MQNTEIQSDKTIIRFSSYLNCKKNPAQHNMKTFELVDTAFTLQTAFIL